MGNKTAHRLCQSGIASGVPGLYPPLTVILSGFFDSIGLYTQPGDQHLRLAHEWLELLGLSAEANTPFHTLSFGQQRLLLIARAMVKHPPLLILDEPLQGLDPLNRHLVKEVVSLLLQQGATQLLFVSHHVEDAPRGLTHRLAFVRTTRVTAMSRVVFE